MELIFDDRTIANLISTPIAGINSFTISFTQEEVTVNVVLTTGNRLTIHSTLEIAAETLYLRVRSLLLDGAARSNTAERQQAETIVNNMLGSLVRGIIVTEFDLSDGTLIVRGIQRGGYRLPTPAP